MLHRFCVSLITTIALVLTAAALTVASAQTSSEEVSVTSDGLEYASYLAAPDADLDAGPDTGGVRPAVVLMHSIMGLQEGYRTLSDQLAAEGYVVLALGWQDYEREPELAMMDRLLRDAIAFLRERDDVDPERIGLTGFCIGGYYVMYFLPTIDDFASGVAWYGFPNRGAEGERPGDEAIIAQLEQPMLIVHGTADQPSPIADIYQYATALDAQDKFFELKVYQGEPHSFLVSGELLRTPAATDAYQQMVLFFDRTLAETAAD